MDCLAIASSSVLGLKMTILSKNAIFRPKTELEAIARWSVEASREVDCAYFGNIGRNSGYFLLPIFLGSYLSVKSSFGWNTYKHKFNAHYEGMSLKS